MASHKPSESSLPQAALVIIELSMVWSARYRIFVIFVVAYHTTEKKPQLLRGVLPIGFVLTHYHPRFSWRQNMLCGFPNAGFTLLLYVASLG